MTLNRDGWLLKFARIGNAEAYKDSVSLCELFWDCVGSVILITMTATLAGLVIAAVGGMAWLHPWILAGTVAGLIGLGLGVAGVEAKMKQDDSIVRAAYDGIKNKFCPVMKIV